MSLICIQEKISRFCQEASAENACKTQDTVVACWQKQVLQSPSHLEAVAIPGEAENSAMCVGGSFQGIKMDGLDPPL